MSARLTFLASAIAAVTVVSWGSRGEAQAWLSDRSRAEGIGIRAGNLELHPGIGAEIGYDSNVFLRDTDVKGSAIARVTPHLFLSTLGAQRTEADPGQAPQPTVDFRLGASLPVLFYFNTERRTRIEANADLGLQLLPGRPVSFVLNGRYTRTERPFASGPENISYGRNTMNVAPGIGFQTVGGVLRASVGGSFTYDFFDNESFGTYDSKSYGANVSASWEFLPKTALIYQAEAAFRDYESNSDPAAAMTTSGAARRSDGTRWAFRGGVNGALSARISATLMAGYTATFFKNGDDRDSPTVAAELRWKPTDTITTSVGYDRTLTAAFQGNFHTNDRVGAKFELLAGGAFLMSAGAHFTYVQYGADELVDETANEARVDNRVGADLSGEYRFADWIAMTANTSVTTNMTDYQLRTPGMGATPVVLDPVKFTRFDAFLGLRIFY